MSKLAQLKSWIEESFVQFCGAVFVFMFGMYNSTIREPEAMHPIMLMITGTSLLIAMLYILIYGLRFAPYRQLKRVTAAGFAIYSSCAVLFASAVSSTASLRALPAGDAIFVVHGTIGIVSIGLAALFSLRWLYLKINDGNDGNNSGRGGTPEENVLSDEELADFDDPLNRFISTVRA